MCLSSSNKVHHIHTVYDLDIKSRSNMRLQLNPQMWFPVDVQYITYVYLALIRCYRLLKCDGTVFDLDLVAKVKYDITNGFFRCGFLLILNTFLCLSCINEVLQTVITVLNIFPMSELFDLDLTF